MNDLKAYVDKLFFKYEKYKDTQDLKAEILANLEAKKADLMDRGIPEAEAVEAAKESLTSVDYLIDGNKNIYLRQFQLESIQIALLYLVSVWFVTIPLTLFFPFLRFNLLLIPAIIAIGVIYLILRSDKSESTRMRQGFINLKGLLRLKKFVWLAWAAFTLVSAAIVTGVYFGSNIWFHRPVRIDGPYQFAILLGRYIKPFFLIVIPLFASRLPGLVKKYEAGEPS